MKSKYINLFLKNSKKSDHVLFCYFLNRSTEFSNLAYFKQYSYFPICVPNVSTHFSFVFTHFPFEFTRFHSCSIRFHSCSLVFIRVPLVFIRVHSCSSRVHSCSFVFHSCSFVFTRVHSCSDLCDVLDMMVIPCRVLFSQPVGLTSRQYIVTNRLVMRSRDVCGH